MSLFVTFEIKSPALTNRLACRPASSENLPASAPTPPHSARIIGNYNHTYLFSIDAGDLNLSPHAHKAAIVPTEPHPQPSSLSLYGHDPWTYSPPESVCHLKLDLKSTEVTLWDPMWPWTCGEDTQSKTIAVLHPSSNLYHSILLMCII